MVGASYAGNAGQTGYNNETFCLYYRSLKGRARKHADQEARSERKPRKERGREDKN